jgi:hypothetical protein
MKTSRLLLRLCLASIVFTCGAAWAQVSKNVPKTVVDTDMTAALLSETTWSGGTLPGNWMDTSTASDKKGHELRSMGLMFGLRPQQVQAWTENGKLVRMDVVFLEAGNFFGFKKSDSAIYKQKNDQTRKEERVAEKELEELKKKEEKEFAVKREEFAKLFAQIEKDLPATLEKFCGKPGERVNVGQTRMLRSRATEFATSVVRMRFTAEDDQLISLAIIPMDTAAKSARLATVTGSQRRADAKESVKTLPGGDVVLDAIPMVNQGSRGYCAIGTLAMIGKYYGVEVNIDQLASRAGYKEGDTDNASIIPIYEAAAKEGRMRMRQQDTFSIREAMRELDKGHPILVWRWFSRERDAFHHKFAKDHAKNASLTLPDPKKDKADRAMWPNDKGGGHASLITGYNKERDEVLFTESWGEGNRHRRMRVEEMESTVYVAFYFEP